MKQLKELISLKSYAIYNTLPILLQDKTTKKNIIWATNSYELQLGEDYDNKKQITIGTLTGLNPIELQPRILKDIEEQQARTKNKAEVFTPSWLCNKMNNFLDEDWFGKKDVFNRESGETWITNENKIEFLNGKTWEKYVDSRRLEITCGEAPYLVSRYDAANGKTIIPPNHRIGILDRKLRVVNENTSDEKEWFTWINRAFESTYGYEFQGDNLLIGRINLLLTFVDNMEFKWSRKPTVKELHKISNTISWNLWQMDGLSCRVPLGAPKELVHKPTIFDFLNGTVDKPKTKVGPKCKIKDWRSNKSIVFEDIKRRNIK